MATMARLAESAHLRSGLRAVAAALTLLVLAGCGAAQKAATYLPPGFGGAERRKAPVAEEPEAKQSEAAKDENAGGAPAAPQLAASLLAPKAGERRARIYSGWCRLTVDEPEQAKKQLEELARESGGYVESSAGEAVTLRVPAEHFRKVFAAVLGLGDVVSKSIETYDVTDTLTDQEARLSLAERARERLYLLLERTAEVKERLAILREIRRLTEEIEGIRAALQVLKGQIAMSRITVELLARRPEGELRQEGIPFPWIAALNPLYPSLKGGPRRLAPALSEDFAVFRKEKGFRAESPEGTRLRLGTTPNRPRGDAAFWQKALAFHLGPQFRRAEELEAGAFRAVLLTSKDSKPYSYLVAVAVRGKRLTVAEAFFPGQEAADLRLEGVLAALRQLKL
jgi:predicted small lipoprotein YifL